MSSEIPHRSSFTIWDSGGKSTYEISEFVRIPSKIPISDLQITSYRHALGKGICLTWIDNYEVLRIRNDLVRILHFYVGPDPDPTL